MTRGGNRRLNSALHRIAIVQIRLDGPGRDYFRRRINGDDTRANAMRCLKRRISRKLYYGLRADYQRRLRLSAQPAADIETTSPA